MKKLFLIVLPMVLIFCFLVSILDEIAFFYSDDGIKDGFYIVENKIANCCFVSVYNCTEYTENQEITIPDEFDNKPITRIGGFSGRGVKSPFGINVGDLYMNAPEGSDYHAVFSGDINDFEISDNYHVEELTFILNIGKNIKHIEYVVMDEYYPHLNEDGSVTFYHPVVKIKCSDKNKYFYSKNGKLYNKKTKELISEFEYAE